MRKITGSDVDRWGLGVVQEIDSAAMHLFARWQHLSVRLVSTCGQLDARLFVLDNKRREITSKQTLRQEP